jgi:type IV pilus assembly protein PilC
MAHFTYTATKNDGETYHGMAEAADRFELYNIVRREGGHIVSIVEEEGRKRWFSLSYWNTKLSHVSEYEKILFARNLGAMLSAGLPLTRALSVIERQTKNPRLSSIVAQIGSDVRHGDNFNSALAKFPKVFPSVFVAMVRAGEESGDLTSALSNIADQLERIYELKKKIRGAMIYPSIVLIAMIGISIVMMIVVVPTLAQTFAEMHVTLPLSTRIIITISQILKAYTVYALLGIIAGIGSIYAISRTRRGAYTIEWIALHIPVIGQLVREVNAARTARTLSSLLAAGVDVMTALSITMEVVQNTHFRSVLLAAREGVTAGDALSTWFVRREDLYPAFVGEMMSVGEETGTTADMLKKLAIYYEDEVNRKTKDMSTIIEPFLMLIIGAGVGFFAVSMITPIYSISQNI